MNCIAMILNSMNNSTRRTQPGKAWTILGTLALCWLLNGCSTVPYIKSTWVTPGPDATQRKSVKIYKSTDKPPDSYQLLGAVSTLPSSHGIMYVPADNDCVIPHMKNEASAMGADMLIGFNRGTESRTARSWSTAIAAKTRDPGDSSPLRLGDFCVAVPHSVIPSDPSKGIKASRDDFFIQKLAQYHLALKGYYSISVDVQPPDSFEEGLNALPAEDLAKYGGDNCDLIFGLMVVKSSGVGAVVVTTQSTELEVALYSKSQKKIIWRSTAEGKYFSSDPTIMILGWAELFVPTSKRASAMDAALDKAFETLPEVSTKTIGTLFR